MTSEAPAPSEPIADASAVVPAKARTWSALGLIVAASIVLGFVVGAIWRFVAPTPELVIQGGGVGYAQLTNSGIGMDLSFGLLTLVAGVVVAIGSLVAFKQNALFPVLGVVIGGLIGSVIAWRFGMFLDPGPNEYGPELARGRADNEVFDGPVVLSAFGVLGMWVLGGVLTLAIGFGLRARKLRRAYEAAEAELTNSSATDA